MLKFSSSRFAKLHTYICEGHVCRVVGGSPTGQIGNVYQKLCLRKLTVMIIIITTKYSVRTTKYAKLIIVGNLFVIYNIITLKLPLEQFLHLEHKLLHMIITNGK